ncbi:MAG: Ig-like domain-containing protein, partial [Alphaproteobacteria bacterium]
MPNTTATTETATPVQAAQVKASAKAIAAANRAVDNDSPIIAGPAEIVLMQPEKGATVSYLVTPGARIDMDGIDMANSKLNMVDGDLHITLPNGEGSIILLDFGLLSDKDTNPIMRMGGQTVEGSDLIAELDDFSDIEPAAGPEQRGTPTLSGRDGYLDPSRVSPNLNETPSVISDVINPFLINQGFGGGNPDLQPNEPGEAPGATPAAPVNTNPDAVNDTATTVCGTAVTIAVLPNDTDPENDTLSVTRVASNPAHGTAVLNANGTITYTPTAGYVGSDSFTYTITDGNGGTDTATVNITVTNTNPDAVNDTATTGCGVPVTVAVLANDTDANGHPVSVSRIVSGPANGTAVLNANGTIT